MKTKITIAIVAILLVNTSAYFYFVRFHFNPMLRG